MPYSKYRLIMGLPHNFSGVFGYLKRKAVIVTEIQKTLYDRKRNFRRRRIENTWKKEQ
jgi:hypothetical protein